MPSTLAVRAASAVGHPRPVSEGTFVQATDSEGLADARGPVTRRVALYSHDTQGLGHVRRNSLIAAALVAGDPAIDVLLLNGAPEAAALPMPPRTDLVTVPSLRKDDVSGAYSAGALTASLDQVIAIRGAVLGAALTSFAPDLLLVDKAARGVCGEIEQPLRLSRRLHGTRTVLGLRDVLDSPSATAEEWQDARTLDAVRDLYDEVWVYGDPVVFDPAREYDWPSVVTRKVRYTGYLAHGRSELLAARVADPLTSVDRVRGPFVLGLVGGGQDGPPLARAFASARFPTDHRGVLITGPYLDKQVLDELRTTAAGRDDLLILEFVPDAPSFVRNSAATVSMGGYNSVCELLASRRPMLLVPRTHPRMEQAIRAKFLEEAGLADVLESAQLTPPALTGWLAEAVTRRETSSADFDLDGLARIPALAARLLSRNHDVAGVERVPAV